MTAASWPRERTLQNRLMVLRPETGDIETGQVASLGEHLGEGDLLVVNDAATFPGSIRGRLEDGAPVELRLIQERPQGRWLAAILGPGDWRQRTEDRPDPRPLRAGEWIHAGPVLRAQVVGLKAPRLLELRFDSEGASFWEELYRLAKPIQYSYLRGELAPWSAQTAYGSRPWSAEMPSAGHALRWELLLALRKKGVGLAGLTHAAGISSTGDPETDRRLPLAERYHLPTETVDAIGRARRVIAVGTSVVRALEGSRLRNRGLVPGEGVTALRLGRSFRPKVVDGLLTGMHELGESHFRLLEAFAPRALLSRAQARGEAEGFLSHEFGDSCLILPAGPPRLQARLRVPDRTLAP